MIFQNREKAGQKLAEMLTEYCGVDGLVLAVPRGGVVVGYQIAQALNLPLDVIVPRKLGAPGEPELAIGAVAPWGDHEVILDQLTVQYLGVTDEYIRRETKAQIEEIDRRLHEYRGTTESPNVRNKAVILVDDGIATGYTIQAALRSLRQLVPSKIVLAVPVAASDSAQLLSKLVDSFHAIATPTPFIAVGHWYEEFMQTTDGEVISLLRRRKVEIEGNAK